MKIEPSQSELAVAKLNQLWRERPCEGCGGLGWSISDHVFQLVEYEAKMALKIGGPRVPVLIATCPTCSLTRLVNAITLGLIDAQTGEWQNG